MENQKQTEKQKILCDLIFDDYDGLHTDLCGLYDFLNIVIVQDFDKTPESLCGERAIEIYRREQVLIHLLFEQAYNIKQRLDGFYDKLFDIIKEI